MRFLFITCGGVTVEALAPLASAARTCGHEVIMVSERDSVRAIVELGLPGAAVTDLSFAEALFQDREGRPVEIPVGPDQEWAFAGAAFGKLAAACYPALERLVADWRPDVVVGGTHSHAAALVAHRFGLPFARQAWDLHARDPRGVAAAEGQLGPELAALGLSALPEAAVEIGIAPPSVAPEGPPPGLLMRWTPGNHQRPLRPWMYTRPEGRRRVVITSGSRTEVDPESLGEAFFGRLLACPTLVAEDVEVVVATDDDLAARLVERHPRIRAGWTPLDVLVHTADLVVHHGGGVTAMLALGAGVPQVVLPVIQATGDAFRRIDEFGAAVTFDSDGEPGESVDAACAKVLGDLSYRDRARELAREMAGLPAPHETVREVERLVLA